jgi:hypothetical protein
MKIHRIVGRTMGAALRPGQDPRWALDESAALGFTLARTFCGVLPWAEQELRDVYDRLPGYLDALRERGMHGYLSYITEAGQGYDLDAHVRELEAITAGRDNVLREVANEPWHPTQGGRLPAARCAALAGLMTGPVAFGAAEDDEATTYDGGAFCGPHLSRSRDKWNQVRRVREMEAKRIPTINQEPIGAAEASIPGKREADPNFFFTLGALNRLFEVGGVFHSEDGLHARQLWPNQRLCAEAFVQGSRIWPHTDTRLRYLNAGHTGSPVVRATFNDGQNREGCTRAYSGVLDAEGFTIALGVVGNHGVEFGNGWRPTTVLAERPGVVAWRVERS